LFPTQVVFQG